MLLEVVAVVLGVGVGLSLGALGGGGSTLAVPVLVFVAGMSARDATAASLLVVGVAALVGAAGHYRSGNVALGTGITFGLAGIVGSTIGTRINRSLDQQLLLVAFACLIAFVAVRMYRSTPAATAPELISPTTAPVQATAALAGAPTINVHRSQPPATGSTLVTSSRETFPRLEPAGVARLGAAATGVGLLTGLFGVGGGFVVVPALTLLLGFATRHAIGTSLVVIAVNAAIALAMRSSELALNWPLVGAFLGAVTLGVLWGTRVGNRLDAQRLTRSFAVLLGAVAIYTAVGALFT